MLGVSEQPRLYLKRGVESEGLGWRMVLLSLPLIHSTGRPTTLASKCVFWDKEMGAKRRGIDGV